MPKIHAKIRESIYHSKTQKSIMPNLNFLTLQATQPIATGANTTAVDALAVDQLANDLGRPIKVVGIQISVILTNPTANKCGIGRIILGTQQAINQQSNLFEWLISSSANATPIFATPNFINETIGNFKDVMFEIEPFETGQQITNIGVKGQLFLNLRAQSPLSQADTFTFRVFIKLYYKL